MAGLGAGGYVCLATLALLWRRRREWPTLPRRVWGMALAHMGAGMLMIGTVLAVSGQREAMGMLASGESLVMDGYTVTYESAHYARGPNYAEEAVVLNVAEGNRPHAYRLTPSRRFYMAERQQTTEAAIWNRWRGDLYATIGARSPQGKQAVRIQFRPLMRWLWLSVIIMAAGAALALTERRKER